MPGTHLIETFGFMAKSQPNHTIWTNQVRVNHRLRRLMFFNLISCTITRLGQNAEIRFPQMQDYLPVGCFLGLYKSILFVSHLRS